MILLLLRNAHAAISALDCASADLAHPVLLRVLYVLLINVCMPGYQTLVQYFVMCT